MDTAQMRKALAALDRCLSRPTQLLIGGGAAMALGYRLPIATADIDGIVFKSETTQAELEPLVRKVGAELDIPKDWLNSYFNTFLYALPPDYSARLKKVYSGRHLTTYALGRDDLVILKCCAGRDKDQAHARALLKQGLNRKLVSDHLQSLMEKGVHGAQAACDFFDEICDQVPE